MRRVALVLALAAIAEAPAACGGQPAAPRPPAPPPPARPAPSAFRPPPPPVPLRLELDGAPGEVNPNEQAHKLALFTEDEWGRVLPCPRELDKEQPAAPDRHRCAYPAAAALGLAGHTLWAAVGFDDHEFDGMYGHRQGIVLVEPGSLRPIATLVQWDESVVDCRSELRMRRRNVADLDGDGLDELCIETVEEAGVGLFEVMDLGDHRRKWLPNRRTRQIDAFVYDPRRSRLERAPGLDGRCPRSGYRPFVDSPVVADLLAWRLELQGQQRTARCPDRDQRSSCFDVCD